MNEDYLQGFLLKCSEAGVDPEELLKQAGIGRMLKGLPGNLYAMMRAAVPGAGRRARSAYEAAIQANLPSFLSGKIPTPPLRAAQESFENTVRQLARGRRNWGATRSFLTSPQFLTGAGLGGAAVGGIGIPAAMEAQQAQYRSENPTLKDRLRRLLEGAAGRLE